MVLPEEQPPAACVVVSEPGAVKVRHELAIAGVGQIEVAWTGGPAFATAAGLLHFAVDDRGEARATSAKPPPSNSSFFARVGGWFRENF